MTRLYRPVGIEELALVWDSGCHDFPPRLPEQPIFYPVTSAEYATQIARDWNTKSSGSAGYVTSFDVDDAFLSKFERHVVGAAIHEEYWIPADRLADFNAAVHGLIEVDAAFFGNLFKGYIPNKAGLKGKGAEDQFVALALSWDYAPMDFALEIAVNCKAIYLNCLFWLTYDFNSAGIAQDLKKVTLKGIVEAWKSRHIAPELPSAFVRASSE